MKNSLAVLWGILALVGMLVSGCAKDSTGPGDDNAPSGVTNEQSARVYYATNDEFVQNDVVTFDDQEVAPTDYGTFGKIDAAITPLRWGRFVTQVVRTVTDTIQPGDTIAFVHVHKEINGVFKIRGINGAGDTVLVEKPFTDNSDRNIIFKRVGHETRRFWLNWLPVATSLVDGGTIPPNNSIDITKVEMFLPNGDTITVTDPLNYYLRYRWMPMFHGGRKDLPQLDPSARIVVQATVVSASPDTDLVALRYGVGTFQKRRFRMQLISEVNNGNGTYTRVYQGPFFVHFHRGFFHAGVDAITRGTLFDDATPYSASWWGIPYRVF